MTGEATRCPFLHFLSPFPHPVIFPIIPQPLFEAMPWSNSLLSLKADQTDQGTRLHFRHPHWETRGGLCTVEIPPDAPLAEPALTDPPDLFTRFLFLHREGLENYSPLLSLQSTKSHGDTIRFYGCSDRLGRSRILVQVTEVESGSRVSFILLKEDFERIRAQISTLTLTRAHPSAPSEIHHSSPTR